MTRRSHLGLDANVRAPVTPDRVLPFIAIYGELPLTRDQEHLAALITARPDATLMELREALRTTARLSTLWREIDRLGLTEIGTGRRTAAP